MEHYVTVQEKVHATDQFGCSIIRGTTGRKTDYHTEEHAEQERLVKSWAACKNQEESFAHESANVFRSLMESLPIFCDSKIKCYRGCHMRPEMIPRPLPHHFGPPPPEYTKAGRYNCENDPVLYLCTTLSGVALEIQDDSKERSALYCQEYLLNGTSLRLANFADKNLNNFIRVVFDYAENGLRFGAIDYDDYGFSQIISCMVKTSNFSGMIVPGVRGSKEHNYNNIILFNPADIWQKYVCTDTEPFCVGRPEWSALDMR
jgi:hypothetical protein